MKFLKRLFTWPGRFEAQWVGQGDEDYHATANRSLLLSFIAVVISLLIANTYREAHGPEGTHNAVLYCVNAGLDVLVLFLVAFLERDTLSRIDRKVQWYICHGLVIFIGGLIAIMTGMFIIVIVGCLFWGYITLKMGLKILFGVDMSSPGRSSPPTHVEKGGSDARGTHSSSDDGGVESQDMFNDELKRRNELGPDSTLVHDSSQDSIYGNTYVDKDTGKEYRVTETDAFGHPTNVEEKWP